jgi:molybdopterin synthase catalytic subunit
VAGAAPTFREHLGLTHDPLDLGALIAEVADPRSGAVASFLGTVRSPNRGRAVHRIDYQGYEAMVDAELRRIGAELREAYPLLGLAVVHRLGVCLPGEASIAIVACSPHRDAAFDACRDALERSKARLPIWKHEADEDGDHWVEGHVVQDARLV